MDFNQMLKVQYSPEKIFQKEKNVSHHNLVEQAVHKLFSLNCCLNINCLCSNKNLKTTPN